MKMAMTQKWRRWAGAGLLLGALGWVGFSHPGQDLRYSPEEWESITVTRYVRSIAPGPRYVGVGTTGGFLVYDRLTGRWRNPLTRADGLPENSVDRVALATGGGFAVYTRRWVGLVEPSTRRLLPDPFLRTQPTGERRELPANLYAGPGYQYMADGRIAGPSGVIVPVMDAAEDDEAGLWVATWGLGVGRADLYSLRLEMEPYGLWHSDVRALALGPDILVAGGLGDAWSAGGITEWRFSEDRWSYMLAYDTPGLLSDRVTGLALDERKLWVAAEGGVSRCEAGGRWRTWTVKDGLPDGRTTAIAVGSGAAWVGTLSGAVAVAGDTVSALPLLAGRVVRDIAAGAGAVWWATETGAHVYRGSWPDGTFFHLEHPEGRLDGQVDAVGASGSEVWWVSSGGVVAYDSQQGVWLDVPGVGPFYPGEATDIAIDRANVWITTTGGVWRLIREVGQWHHYDEMDGLIDRRVWTVSVEGNVVWFGTAEGITRFDWSLRRRRP